MKVLDLFSGIGGFALGLDRAGMETVAFCEIEDYPVSILKKHWPDVPVYRDVKKLKGEELEREVGRIDVICGGFPCQPFSVAGQQKGKEDDRHLWPEMFRLVQEISPRWVIGENVAGFIRMALDDVLFDLESEGYSTQSFVIPACAVGGVHRRDRCWIVAHSRDREGGGSEQRRVGETCCEGEKAVRTPETDETARSSETSGVMANTNSQGLQGQQITGSDESIWEKPNDEQSTGQGNAQHFRPIELPTESPVRLRDDGLPDNMARLKALGNAVVPQIPEMIGRAIMELEKDQ